MPEEPERKRRRRIWPWVILGILATALGWGWKSYRDAYPYGLSHKCNKAISGCLQQYAAENDGKFPNAGGTAESFSLLAKYGIPISQLAGKAIADEDAERCYREKGKLTEEFCSWHYIPGLTTSSNGSLALFWDKTGLLHNGSRAKVPKYEVCFVDGMCSVIPESKWPEFLAQQEKLLKEAGLSPGLLRE